ncbi:MAG: type II toxin-antitoxin system RelE/ParE family toxin [Cyclobacteriaceae bacterium]
MYTVKLTAEVTTFIRNLDLKMRAKVYKTIELLKEFGPFLTEPHSKFITGIKKLRELRIKQGSNIVRLFYFHYKNKTYIITSGYLKKENKINKKELAKAEKILNEIIIGEKNA